MNERNRHYEAIKDHFVKLQCRVNGTDYIRRNQFVGRFVTKLVPYGFVENPPFADFIPSAQELDWEGWPEGGTWPNSPVDLPLTLDAPHCAASLELNGTGHSALKEPPIITRLKARYPEILSIRELIQCERKGEPVWLFDPQAREIGCGVLFHIAEHGCVVSRTWDNPSGRAFVHIISAPADDYGKTWVAAKWDIGYDRGGYGELPPFAFSF